MRGKGTHAWFIVAIAAGHPATTAPSERRRRLELSKARCATGNDGYIIQAAPASKQFASEHVKGQLCLPLESSLSCRHRHRRVTIQRRLTMQRTCALLSSVDANSGLTIGCALASRSSSARVRSSTRPCASCSSLSPLSPPIWRTPKSRRCCTIQRWVR